MLEVPLVLIVEDDPFTNDLIARILKSAGYRSVQAFTNAEGLQRVSETTFSLITTDRGHPGGESGIAFVTEVRSMLNGRLVPILMISGSLTNENELAAWRAGVSAVMHKPFEQADLIAEIGKLLSKPSEKDQMLLGVGIEAPLEQPKEKIADLAGSPLESEQNRPSRFPAVIPSAIASALLLVALLPIRQYGYFVLLRWVVCAASVWLCITAYGKGRQWLLFIGIPLAILFNPLVPIPLRRQTWQPIDLIAAVVLFGFSWFAWAKQPSQTAAPPRTKT